MAEIIVNAFSFLQQKLADKGLGSYNIPVVLDQGQTVKDLVSRLGLGPADVEGVFVNGRVRTWSTELKHGDRVALVPPGTPGPYRVLLGIREPFDQQKPV